MRSGDSFARTGVAVPKSGTGDGGVRGRGGSQGRTHETSWTDEDGKTHYETIIDAYPTPGTQGVNGVAGCVVVYWEKEESA